MAGVVAQLTTSQCQPADRLRQSRARLRVSRFPGMTFAPGIPGELVTYVEATPGLLDALTDVKTPEEVTALLRKAVDEGTLPQVVAQHIDAWNHLKASSPSYLLDYHAFAADHAHLWAQEGLPSPDDGSGFGAPQRRGNKTGRNDCPCGSGRKYKRCCGVS